MELRVYSAGDRWLVEAMECDPAVMAHLGGPQPREKILGIHEKRVAFAAAGGWWFALVPDAAVGAVGTMGIFESEWKGEKIAEMGWMLLPAHHGRGYASAAARLILDRARAERKFPSIHAFPGTGNAASNALCRKSGFTRLEECDLLYGDRPLHCHHWRLDLTPSA